MLKKKSPMNKKVMLIASMIATSTNSNPAMSKSLSKYG